MYLCTENGRVYVPHTHTAISTKSGTHITCNLAKTLLVPLGARIVFVIDDINSVTVDGV